MWTVVEDSEEEPFQCIFPSHLHFYGARKSATVGGSCIEFCSHLMLFSCIFLLLFFLVFLPQISIIQRKYTGLLRRPSSSVLGTVLISMTTSYDGMTLSGVYAVTSVRPSPIVSSTPPAAVALSQPFDSLTTDVRSSAIVEEAPRQGPLFSAVKVQSKAPGLRRWASDEDILSSKPAPLRRYGSLENLV